MITLADGTVRTLPPDLTGIQQPAPGIYTLRSTGEDVRDLDYVYTWTITGPDA